MGRDITKKIQKKVENLDVDYKKKKMSKNGKKIEGKEKILERILKIIFDEIKNQLKMISIICLCKKSV